MHLMGLVSWKLRGIFLMGVVSCQAFYQGRSHTLGLHLLVLSMSELTISFLESTL